MGSLNGEGVLTIVTPLSLPCPPLSCTHQSPSCPLVSHSCQSLPLSCITPSLSPTPPSISGPLLSHAHQSSLLHLHPFLVLCSHVHTSPLSYTSIPFWSFALICTPVLSPMPLSLASIPLSLPLSPLLPMKVTIHRLTLCQLTYLC